MRATRIYHSGVVSAWRRRDVELRGRGVDLSLVSSEAWNEGGSVVTLDAEDQPWVISARTWGTHPFLFVYDPRPLWRALRSRPVDVLDVHEEAASLAASEVLLLAWLARRGRPRVSFYCAQNIQKRYPPPFRWLERAVLRRADAAHTCNDEAGRVLRRKGFSGLIRNLGLGVDVDHFAPHPDELRIAEPGSLRVGYVGRLEHHKGVHHLVDAVGAVPQVELAVVGAGPDELVLPERAAELGMSERVTFRGYVDHDELPELYRSFDVVVVPSIETASWIEQFGRVAVEAMASGVPVIASDSGSLPEVLGGAGVLVPPGDVPALAAALERLREDTVERKRLSAAGLARAAHFSWSAVAERHLALYEEMVG